MVLNQGVDRGPIKDDGCAELLAGYDSVLSLKRRGGGGT